MRTVRKAASWILGSLILAGIGASGFITQIETHHLERVLRPGFDAFGRDCALLALSALGSTLLSVLPLAVFCILAPLLISFASLIRSSRLRFLFRSVLDTLSALPGFLIALALGALIPGSGFTAWLGAFFLIVPANIRYFESRLLKIRSESYLLASQSLGAGPLHLLRRHYLPELLDSISAILPFLALRLVFIDTTLSYLGLAAAPEHETWGRLLSQGKDYLIEAPWILFWAALPLVTVLACCQLLDESKGREIQG